MTLRYPMPWEEDQAPRKVEPDLEPVEGAGVDVAFPGATDLVSRAGGDPDPNRRRRGAQGAAGALQRESDARGWGMTRAECRTRVNRARSVSATKKSK